MRVLILTQSYLPVLGGLQQVVGNLSQELAERGNQVVVVTNRYPRSLRRTEEIKNVKVYRWNFFRRWWTYVKGEEKRFDLFLASLFYNPLTLIRLCVLVFRFQPDVINVHFPDIQIPFVLKIQKIFRKKIVVSLHGDEIERWTAKKDSAGVTDLQNLLKSAGQVTACSRYLIQAAASLENSIENKSEVIRNGVDLERFQQLNSKVDLNVPSPYILSYGRFTFKKGFDLLLKAFSNVLLEYPDLNLILAGDGEQDLASLANQLGISKSVHFWGRAAPDEIVELLRGCEFLVIPSRLEPLGLVALEGLAAKKLIVATRVGGMVEVLSEYEKQVIFVEPDTESIKIGILEALAFTERGSNLPVEKKDFLHQYSWQVMTDAYYEVFEKVRELES